MKHLSLIFFVQPSKRITFFSDTMRMYVGGIFFCRWFGHCCYCKHFVFPFFFLLFFSIFLFPSNPRLIPKNMVFNQAYIRFINTTKFSPFDELAISFLFGSWGTLLLFRSCVEHQHQWKKSFNASITFRMKYCDSSGRLLMNGLTGELRKSIIAYADTHTHITKKQSRRRSKHEYTHFKRFIYMT